jgi:pentapeptide repeat protein
MKTKIQIKTALGTLLFELEKSDNTIKKTLEEGVKQGADLRGAYLQGADLQGAYLRGAYLQGADLQGADLQGADLQGADLQGADLRGNDDKKVTIKKTQVFTGLYEYIVIPVIDDKNKCWVRMGCYFRSLEDWEKDFWNNPGEFPNNNSLKSNLRLLAYETAKKWLELNK